MAEIGKISLKVSVDGLKEVKKTLESVGDFVLFLYEGLPENAKLSKEDIVDIITKKIKIK